MSDWQLREDQMMVPVRKVTIILAIKNRKYKQKLGPYIAAGSPCGREVRTGRSKEGSCEIYIWKGWDSARKVQGMRASCTSGAKVMQTISYSKLRMTL